MTIKEVFQLRKQGKIEEAYEAIKPIYARYRGKYTTMCMFWTARDIFNIRMSEGRVEEAGKIFEALKRVAVGMDDKDRHVTSFLQYAERRLGQYDNYDVKAWEKAEDMSEVLYDASYIHNEKTKTKHDPKRDLSASQLKVLEYIEENEGCSAPRISEDTGIPCKSVERHVSALKARGFVVHKGSRKAGGYYVVLRRLRLSPF